MREKAKNLNGSSMKSTCFLSLVVLFTLVSCGEDAGSPRRRAKPETVKPPLTTDKNGIPSHLHRDRGTKVMNSNEAIAYLLDEANQTAAYRSIPMVNIDDEDSSRTLGEHKGRPQEVCGQGDNLAASKRIEDCAKVNKAKSSWESSLLGTAGEADWKLVSRNASGHEVWMDMRTNMMWTDMSSGSNWCRAAGNTEEICKDLNLSSDNRVCKKIPGLNNISWRLPTRNDFLQADLDGIRYVLPRNVEEGYWTATVDSTSVLRDKAWVYKSEHGTLTTAAFSASRPVRCIGVSQ